MIVFDNVRHQFQYGTGEVSEDGKGWIYNHLYANSLPELPSNWDWRMIVPKGEYAGTMPKRLKKYYYKNHNITLSAEFLSNFGSRISDFIDHPKLYDFRFTRDNWKAGDFCDEGSCFWGCRWYAPTIIKKYGGGAIQFFEPNTDRGIGRAWLIPYEDTWVVINGYGFLTIFIGRFLATYLGTSYKIHENIHNLGEYDGMLYINGCKGVILKDYDHDDLDLKIPVKELINICSCGNYTFEQFCPSCLANQRPCIRCSTNTIHSIHSHCWVCEHCVQFVFVDMNGETRVIG